MIAIQNAFAYLSAIWFMFTCCASAARPSTDGARADVSTAIQIQHQEPHLPGKPLPPGAKYFDHPLALQAFFEEGGKLSTREARELLAVAKEQLLLELETAPGIVDLNLDNEDCIHVIGDLHGHLRDLLTIFEIAGSPSPTNPYLFNGDFVDRGKWSVEVIMILLAWKVALPEHVHLNRGNHEYSTVSVRFGFFDELGEKYGGEEGKLLFKEFHEVFAYLPIAHVIAKSVFVTHGGLPFGTDSLSTIRESLTMTRGPYQSSGMEREMVWNDPMPENGKSTSPRGWGCYLFGPDKTREFLERNDLVLVIRSHQPRPTGISIDHDFTQESNGKLTGLMTVFSAADYVDSNNTGAIATVQVMGSSVAVHACHYWHGVHLECELMVEAQEKEHRGKWTGLLHKVKAWKSTALAGQPEMEPPRWPLPPIV